MKPRELCEKAWQEIASHFPNFKILKKGQSLKKISKNKDIVFEICFQGNRRNYSCDVDFLVYFFVQSKKMKKANVNNGFIYGCELEAIIDRGRNYRWFQLAGASYQHSVDEIVGLLQKYILPICEEFENTETNMENILTRKARSRDLFYYLYFFGGKEKAQVYLNTYVKGSKLKSKYLGFYNSLKEIPKENIDLNICEFVDADLIKFAYLNDINFNF